MVSHELMINGAGALASFVGVQSLKSGVNLEKLTFLIKEVSSNNIKLDLDAEKAFQETFKNYISATPNALAEIGNVIVRLQANTNENVAKSIERKVNFVMSLPIGTASQMELVKEVIRYEYEIGNIDKETIKSLIKVFAITVAGTLLIRTISSAYKNARKPTFVESFLGKK